MKRRTLLVMFALLIAVPLFAQAPPPSPQAPPPPTLPPDQLQQLVSRIALYPDSLLGNVLAAATFPDQIPDAAQWSDQHHYLTGQALANAIQADQLPWDPGVQALLPFPSVLEMMASDMNWTTQIGNAFLAQQQAVMDAVQEERHKAWQYGYLRSNGQIAVTNGAYITINPVNPGFIVVPAYDPGVVFFPPAPGFFVGGAIHFGFGINLGVWFRPWGWGFDRFDWGAHRLFIANVAWGRTWFNRGTYVHPFPGVRRFTAAQRAPERHEAIGRSPAERQSAREGRAYHEEHHGGDRR